MSAQCMTRRNTNKDVVGEGNSAAAKNLLLFIIV
jgi:hypothetical protein